MINVLIIDYRDEYSNNNLYSLLNLQKRRATSAALLFCLYFNTACYTEKLSPHAQVLEAFGL